jgi:hypothetical protein
MRGTRISFVAPRTRNAMSTNVNVSVCAWYNSSRHLSACRFDSRGRFDVSAIHPEERMSHNRHNASGSRDSSFAIRDLLRFTGASTPANIRLDDRAEPIGESRLHRSRERSSSRIPAFLTRSLILGARVRTIYCPGRSCEDASCAATIQLENFAIAVVSLLRELSRG